MGTKTALLVGSLLFLAVLAAGPTASAGNINTVVILDPTNDGVGFGWLADVISELDSAFWGGLSKDYSLLIGDADTQSFSTPLSSAYVGLSDFLGALSALDGGPDLTNEGIDGFGGVAQALQTHPGPDTFYIIVSDSALDPWSGMTAEQMGQAIQVADGAFLNVIIDHGFGDGIGESMGAYKGDGFYPPPPPPTNGSSPAPSGPDGGGGYDRVGGVYLTSGTGLPYALAALDFAGGSAWDINFAMGASGDDANAFRRGFADVKVEELAGAGSQDGGNGEPLPVSDQDPTEGIPEPGTAALLLLGAAGLVIARRRRR